MFSFAFAVLIRKELVERNVWRTCTADGYYFYS